MYKIAVLSFGKSSIEFLKVDEVMDKILLPSGRRKKDVA
jgi:hypothetical protein